MATKIGYVSQPPTAQINWAEVGANFSGMLSEEARVREEKKAEIDRATREQIKVLQNTPMGDSKNVREYGLRFGADAQSYLLMLNAALKSGQLKPKDYTIARQNLADGTDQTFSVLQDYQNEYANKMARLKSNDPNASSQELEVYLMQSVEGFGNFNNSQLVIDPLTGNVMVGFKNEKGQLDSDPNKLVGVNNLRNRTTAKFDKYNMDAAVAQGKQSFGKFETIARKVGSRLAKGTITTISDPMFRNQSKINEWLKKGWITQEDAAQMATFDKVEDSWLEGQLSMYNTTSLLTDNLRNIGGQKFNFTFNAEEQNENTILLKQVDGNVVPDFESEIGKKQREIAKDGLRTVLRGAIDHTEKVQEVSDYTAPTYQPEYMYQANQAKKETKDAISQIGNLWGGYSADIESAVNYFRDFRPGIKDVTRDNKGITIVYTKENGQIEQKKIPFYSAMGSLLSQEDFIKAAAPLLTGQKDISTALIKGGYIKDAEFSNFDELFKATTTSGTTSSASVGLTNAANKDAYIREKVGKLNFNLEEDDLKAELEKMDVIQSIPDLVIETTGGTYGNELTLTVGNKKLVLDANNWTSGGEKDAQVDLSNFLSDVLNPKGAAAAVTSGVQVDAEGVPIK
jgi:hypothetical protein